MTITPPSVITVCFLLFVSLSWATVQKNASFFDRYYQEINQNLKHGNYEKNIELIDRIVQQQEFIELDCYLKGRIFHKIGVSLYKLDREKEAIDYYKNKALKVWGNCEGVPQSERAKTIYNIGVSYQYLGELENAKDFLDRALIFFETDAEYPKYELAKKYHGIGKFHKELNDIFRAELYLLNALNLYKEDEKTINQFEVINNLITMNMEFKDYEKAKNYINQALMIYNQFHYQIPKIDLALIYLNAGTTYLGLKEYKIAKQMAQNALELLDKNKEPFYYSIGLELLAIINADLENFDSSEQYMNDVLEIRKQLGVDGDYQDAIARGYENLCDVLIRKGDIDQANISLHKAFEFLLPDEEFDRNNLPIIKKSKILDDRHLIRLIELKTKIFEAQYKDSKNLKFLKKVLLAQHKIDSVINRSLFNFQFEQSKLNFLELKFDHYGKAVEDALELYRITDNQFYLQEAYHFSSKTKAIVLQYELNQVNALQSNVSSEVLKKEKELREEMHKQGALLTEANSSNKDSLLNTFTKAQYALDSYLKEVEKKEPAYIKEKYAFIRPPELKKVQKDLPKDMVVIEYFLTENTMYSFWLTNTEFIPITIPYTEDLKKSFDQFIAQCHNPKTEVSKKLSNDIYNALLQEGLGRIGTSIKRICIIPDGALHKLSFEALTSNQNAPQKYLIENYAISYSYALALLFRNHHKKELSNYIGFGSKYSTDLNQKLKARKRFFGNENLSQLTLSQEEIKRGAAIFDGNTFIDHEATLENFLAYGTQADIIHLSLHGLVDIDNPNKSCIIFDDRKEEFILSPQDLYSNRLQADLVLLSACHSASGKIYNGEGVQGMSKSFLLGGAHNILSSLWNASEASSMAITTTFLEYIHEGQPIDLALYQSKLDYLSKSEPNKRHPYYWANFILLGEIESSNSSLPVFVWVALIGILILFIALIIVSSKKKSSL
ncbi:CHAT domain-containing tetratricopeptide repeat protein [Aquimarina gracilis]|uniref:CHAT domain-containing tetratricopeptide repeat protein n=1 Tax=Aquimarina gracilis TaxID=874422 RepID=A0ABU5ZX60_9FLAO|nr:CHAT domain-containing tetratricopeptide repeat protein [Aquimarina gracilis]MEB3346459.1 CHAT domain-containing tetratricopeptide repeat protein [Aquimarina gracilis]